MIILDFGLKGGYEIFFMKKAGTFYHERTVWDDFLKAKGNSWRHRDYAHLESIFPVNIFEGTLLDVGCALGDGILYLTDKCPKVTKFYGADISIVGVKKCQNDPKLSHANFFQHDVCEKFQEKYDTIICLQTLEHVPDPEKAVRNLRDAANKLLIVGTPHLDKRGDSDHMWSFDEEDFVNLLSFYIQDWKNIYWTWGYDEGKK